MNVTPVDPASADPVHAASGRVARNFLALVSGEAAARIVAFGTAVYVARTLGAEAYGVIGFALAIVLYLSRIADGGMEFFGLGVRHIAEDRSRIVSVAPHLMTARMLIAAVLVIGLAAFAPLLPSPDGEVLAVYGLTLLAVGAGTRWIHLGLERTRLIAIARTAGEASVLLLVLLFVSDRDHIVRVPLAQFSGDMLAAILLLGALRRHGFALRLRLRLDVVVPVFRRAVPLVLSALLGLVIYNSDLIFLRFFRDAEAVGYYAAAYTLISFLVNLGGAFSQSLMPTLTRLSTSPGEQNRLYADATLQVFAVTAPLAAGGFLLAPGIIDLVFGEAFDVSSVALQILIWSIPFSILREVAIVALVTAGRQAPVLRVTAGSAALNLALNLALIPRYGIIGAAVSTVITDAVRWAAALAYARGAGFRSPSLLRFWRPFAAAAAMTAALVLVSPGAVWSGVLLGVLAYAVTLTLVGGMRWGRSPELRL